MTYKLHRVIDANLNRSREALRVCEDLTRFILDDEVLTKSFKDIRHKITKIANVLFQKDMSIKYRNSLKDVGRKNSFDRIKTSNLKSLFYKNSHRAQESMRGLEEFSKLMIPALSKDFKVLRFKLYSLEKKTIKKWKDNL